LYSHHIFKKGIYFISSVAVQHSHFKILNLATLLLAHSAFVCSFQIKHSILFLLLFCCLLFTIFFEPLPPPRAQPFYTGNASYIPFRSSAVVVVSINLVPELLCAIFPLFSVSLFKMAKRQEALGWASIKNKYPSLLRMKARIVVIND